MPAFLLSLQTGVWDTKPRPRVIVSSCNARRLSGRRMRQPLWGQLRLHFKVALLTCLCTRACVSLKTTATSSLSQQYGVDCGPGASLLLYVC